MDRTQYGKVTVGDTYRPYDLACRNKPLPGYALLADLQNNMKTATASETTTHRSTAQAAQYSTTKYHHQSTQDHSHQDESQSDSRVYANSTSSPVPEHSHHPAKTPNIYTNLPNGVPNDQNMYKHEHREEIRTETSSSGPNLPPTRSVMSNNLTELDSLLQDLNSAKHSSLKELPMLNGGRPSVDSLLDDLNSVGHSETIEQRSSSQYNHKSSNPSMARSSHASASNATKELDDLMASLSDFKQEESSTTEEVKKERTVKTSESVSSEKDSYNDATDIRYLAGSPPPRPPAPYEEDVLAVPPPRPPAPSCTLMTSNDLILPATLPCPIMPVAPTPTVISVIERRPDSVADDPLVRPPSGGPVKRNDAEYRWVTDEIKHEIREIIEAPVIEKRQEKLRSPAMVRKLINASSLQSQVDNAYAKPKKPSPPPPPPAPKEPSPPTDQLDSLLGSLTSHMTEQGVTTRQKGCCCACDKPIVGEVITALGKTWHPEHFVCAHCQHELGTQNFFERDGKPYCEPDYHELFSTKCAYCNGPILDKVVTALNKTWHPDHFFCAQCGNTFGESGFHVKDGKPYCKEDYYNLFAPKCGSCQKPIMENYITALNSQWHPDCFVCRDCRKPFNGGSFFDHEGLPYCEMHYHEKRGSLCAGCHKPITGRCITAMFKKFHPEHFVCTFCLQQLNKGTFKEQNDKPYCHTCFEKLFG